MLIVFGVAVVLVLPSIALLFTLAQRSLIEEGEPGRSRIRERGSNEQHSGASRWSPSWTSASTGAMREARTEAVVVLAVEVALLGGLAALDKAKGWDIIDLPWWAWLLLAAPALLLMILLLAVPLAELSPGRVRNAGVALLGLLVAADAVAVGVLLAALAGSSAGSLSAGELLAHGAVVWLTNIITFGLLFWHARRGRTARPRRARAARPRLRVPAGRQAGEPAGAHG